VDWAGSKPASSTNRFSGDTARCGIVNLKSRVSRRARTWSVAVSRVILCAFIGWLRSVRGRLLAEVLQPVTLKLSFRGGALETGARFGIGRSPKLFGRPIPFAINRVV
jgi:hypothetical protein